VCKDIIIFSNSQDGIFRLLPAPAGPVITKLFQSSNFNPTPPDSPAPAGHITVPLVLPVGSRLSTNSNKSPDFPYLNTVKYTTSPPRFHIPSEPSPLARKWPHSMPVVRTPPATNFTAKNSPPKPTTIITATATMSLVEPG